MPNADDPRFPRTLHLVVDMQRLFAEPTEWHLPALAGILPNVVRLVEQGPRRRLFARFTVPRRPEQAPGQWRHYYRRWHGMTGAELDPHLIDLVEPLAPLAKADQIHDKPTYSAFAGPELARRLEQDGIDTIVMTGVETDICVLASLLGAVDAGFRVILPVDAVTSSSPESHRAVIDHVLPRMPDQVTLTTTDALLGLRIIDQA